MKKQIKLITGLFLVVFMLGSINAEAGHRNRRNRSCGTRVVIAPPMLPIVFGTNRNHRHFRGCAHRRNLNTCNVPRYNYNNGCANGNGGYYNNGYGNGYGHHNGGYRRGRR
jgi:hypothetical protein